MEKVLVSGLNEADAGVRLEFALARAEVAVRAVNISSAAQYAAIAAALREAREHPELYLGDTVRYVGAGRFAAGRAGADRVLADRVDFAERAAVADLAVRLHLSENTIRSQGLRATELRRRTPSIWAAFADGEVSVGNATVAAEFAVTLPSGAVCTAFDDALLGPARQLPTPRFRERARRVREQLDPQTLAVRHSLARLERRVWFEADRDGMCWLGAYLPAEVGRLAMGRLDAAAASLTGRVGETRTRGQLRADIAGDLLTGAACDTTDGTPCGSVPTVSVSVAVTVPVLTLLGVSELPGTLEGYGPIDADTARRLAGHAPSFQRILTHPITGTLLDIDRASYTVPADLKRWTQLRDQHCTFPGCGRAARDCDLDHTTAWQHGGPTGAANLSHLCRHHHRLKHESNWQIDRDPDGTTTWTSPTGATHTTDPPPF
ncbi:MAG: HNH endonuclease [Actinomycetota bacterium]|nr:HNH endonuclease [Actinomycetota bacterium]